MRVVVSLRQLYPAKIGGLETYVRALLDAWGRSYRDDEWIVLINPEAAPTFSSPGPWMRFETVENPHDLNLWRAAIDRHAPGVMFSPLLTIDPVDAAMPCVVNIPDMQHATYPEFFSPEVMAFRRFLYPLSAHRAEAIVTLSSHAKSEIAGRLGVPAGKIHAIPLAAGAEYYKTPTPGKVERFIKRHGLPPRFMLFPANFWPHKNHEMLFAALARYRKAHGEVPPLALSGFPVDRQGGMEKSLQRHGLSDSVHFLGYLPKEELPLAYHAAEFLIFPSLFEGFGLPVAEAFASGCPVACAAATSLPELAGDAALTFNPSDPAEIAARIHDLWTDPALRRKLAKSGQARARQLTWSHTAAATHAVLRKVASRVFASATAAPHALTLLPGDRIDPASLPAVGDERAKILHFLRPGSEPVPGALDAARALFGHGGLAAALGALRPGEAGETVRFRHDSERLRGENYLPLEGLWIGPRAAAETIAWLREHPDAHPYEIWLRSSTRHAIGECESLVISTRDAAPAKVGARQGAGLSKRYFGVSDERWLAEKCNAAVLRIPLIGHELRRRHRTRQFLAKLLQGLIQWRESGKLPKNWKWHLDRWTGRRSSVPPTPDGWIADRGRLRCVRKSDSLLKITLDSPLWPYAQPPRVRIKHRSTLLCEMQLHRRGCYPLSLPWPPGEADEIDLTVECSRSFIPARHGLGGDERRLGVRVNAG